MSTRRPTAQHLKHGIAPPRRHHDHQLAELLGDFPHPANDQERPDHRFVVTHRFSRRSEPPRHNPAENADGGAPGPTLKSSFA